VYNKDMQMSFEVNGQRLRQLRVERALSLRALAQRGGVAFDTINKRELGHRPARLVTIRKLAAALEVEPRELMKGEDDD
jgi:transcriptional regulator with XRE-family HTH domain